LIIGKYILEKKSCKWIL